MLTYRGVEITKEIIGSYATGAMPTRIARYHATIDQGMLIGQPVQRLTGKSEDEICDKIDEALGPETGSK